MNVNTSKLTQPQKRLVPSAPAEKSEAQATQTSEPKETVTFDADKGCYHFESPGLHQTKCVVSPFKEGAQIATVVGAPLLLGAVQGDLLGGLGSVGVNVLAGPVIGMGLGGTMLGYGAHKMSRGNPIFTGIGAVVGAAGGAFLYPVTQLAGTALGYQGALITAGVAGVGAAIYTAMNNSSIHQEAVERGFQPS